MSGQRAHLLLMLGRTGEAASAIREADRVVQLATPEGHRYRGDVRLWLGMVEFAEGDAVAAATHFAEALEMQRDQIPGNPKAAGAACALGVALARQERLEEARPYLEESCPVYARRGTADPLIVSWGREARRALDRRGDADGS
jgi:Flp pilus assembly protein TadD